MARARRWTTESTLLGVGAAEGGARERGVRESAAVCVHSRASPRRQGRGRGERCAARASTPVSVMSGTLRPPGPGPLYGLCTALRAALSKAVQARYTVYADYSLHRPSHSQTEHEHLSRVWRGPGRPAAGAGPPVARESCDRLRSDHKEIYKVAGPVGSGTI
eukprot:281055-Prymnesium_polylepis.1